MVIGSAEPGEPGPLIFEEIATQHGLKFFPSHKPDQSFALLPREAFGKLDGAPELGSERAVFLLCLGRNRAHVVEVIHQIKLRRAHAEVVVLDDETHDSGVLAVECLFPENGFGAVGYLVRGRFSASLIRHQLLRLFGQLSIYPPFPGLRLAQSVPANQALVATPYHDLALADYYFGILPAARTLGLNIFLSSDEVTQESVLEKVRQHIDRSSLVIVNLSEYHALPANPNVYFELGYSLGRGLPVVLIQWIGATSIPANLAGAQLIQYESCSELTMRLCFGLK
jgi:hypothetical protein